MARLEGHHAPFSTAADRKRLIGRRVRYLRHCDIDKTGRGYFFPRSGNVTDARGTQIILGDGNSVSRGDLVELVDDGEALE